MDATRLEALQPGAADLDRAAAATAVTYVADRRYLPLALASAASAAAGLSRPLPFVLLLVDTPDATEAAARDFLRDRGLLAEMRRLDLRAGATDLSRLPTMRDSISPATYGRLIAAPLLPEFDTILYLDGDTLIDGDLGELALIRPATLAAVESERKPGVAPRVYSLNGLDPAPSYFNAGVCLMNADLWRRDRLSERALALAGDAELTLTMGDQDVLNLIFGRAYHRLDSRWNFTKGTSWRLPDKRPAIAHFAGRIYPWDPRDRRCPQVYRDRYAALFAEMPAAITGSLSDLMMPAVEVNRARNWTPILERWRVRRRSGWNPAHAALLARRP